MVWSRFYFFFFLPFKSQIVHFRQRVGKRHDWNFANGGNVVPLVYRCCVVVPQQGLLCLATHHEMPFLFYFYIYIYFFVFTQRLLSLCN